MIFQKNMFIVSCQALADEPLFGGDTILKIAKAAVIGGADAIRTSQIKNINLIKAEIDLPIIGLIKQKYQNSEVVITPTLQELKQLVNSGIEVVAIDATLRKRPEQKLTELVNWFRENKKPQQLLMADCSNQADVENAQRLGFDIIGTTLHGYTAATAGMSNLENDFAFIKLCRTLTNKILIAEGGIWTPLEAKNSLKAGADAVVVGSAITRPRLITKRFNDTIKGENNE